MGKHTHHLSRDFESVGQAIGLCRDTNRRMAVEQEVILLRDQRGEALGGRSRVGTVDD
jgi:hypothetical protein